MRLKRIRQSSGFALPAAIFIVIIIASTVASMSNVSSLQSHSAALNLQYHRAFWAAKAGIDWAGHTVTGITPGNCFSTNDMSIQGFSVEVRCSVNTFSEGSGSANLHLYLIQAEATPVGTTVDGQDYVYRALNANFVLRD